MGKFDISPSLSHFLHKLREKKYMNPSHFLSHHSFSHKEKNSPTFLFYIFFPPLLTPIKAKRLGQFQNLRSNITFVKNVEIKVYQTVPIHVRTSFTLNNNMRELEKAPNKNRKQLIVRHKTIQTYLAPIKNKCDGRNKRLRQISPLKAGGAKSTDYIWY